MSRASAKGEPFSARFGTDALAVGYRLVLLASVLIVAALTDTLSGHDRLFVLGPIVASGVAAFALRSRELSVLLLVAEVAAATAIVAASGGPQSPFVAYFTVPLVDAALRLSAFGRSVAIVAALAGLALATAIAGGVGMFGMAIVSEGTLVVALPILVSLVGNRQQSIPAVPLPLTLPPEDWELLARLATGATYAEIADQLTVSVETVKVRVSRLYRRIGARNRTEALAFTEDIRPR